MSQTAIHGYQLEITVVCCWDLRDSSTKFHDQDPYVRLEYANVTYRTQICKRQSKDPLFNQKFTFVLSEGRREIGVAVWNKNTIEKDYLIGTARVPLTTVLLDGFHEGWWPLQYENRPAGQIKLLYEQACSSGNILTHRLRNIVVGYDLPVPADLHSAREAAVPYLAYPPSSYPITSQPLPSIPQSVLLPPTENKSVSYVTAQPVPPPQQTLLVSPTIVSIPFNPSAPSAPEEPSSYDPPPPQQTLLVSPTIVSIPFNPSAPSAPEEPSSYDPPPPPPLIVVPSSYTPSSTDLQNHPDPVSPSSYVPPRYEEERAANRGERAVEEERNRRTNVEPTKPSLNQPLVQISPPHPSRPQIFANSARQRKPNSATTAEESYTTGETTKSSSKASPSPSGKARLYVFVFCLLFTLYVKVGCPVPDLSWVGL